MRHEQLMVILTDIMCVYPIHCIIYIYFRVLHNIYTFKDSQNRGYHCVGSLVPKLRCVDYHNFIISTLIYANMESWICVSSVSTNLGCVHFQTKANCTDVSHVWCPLLHFSVH